MYYETIEKFFEEKTYNKYIKTHKDIETAFKTYLYKNKNKIYNKKTNQNDVLTQTFKSWDMIYFIFEQIRKSNVTLNQDQLKKVLHKAYQTKKPNKLNQNKLKCLG
jgi:hypothetical protein